MSKIDKIKIGDITYDISDPNVPEVVRNITEEDINNWNDVDNKQENLVSGKNIKTINYESILGYGNIPMKTINGESIIGYGDIYVSSDGSGGGVTTEEMNDAINEAIYGALEGTY